MFGWDFVGFFVPPDRKSNGNWSKAGATSDYPPTFPGAPVPRLAPQSSPISAGRANVDRHDWRQWHHSEWGKSGWPRIAAICCCLSGDIMMGEVESQSNCGKLRDHPGTNIYYVSNTLPHLQQVAEQIVQTLWWCSSTLHILRYIHRYS